VPCGSEREVTISFSQPLSTNLTNTILMFVLFLVTSSICMCIVLIVCVFQCPALLFYLQTCVFHLYNKLNNLLMLDVEHYGTQFVLETTGHW